MSNPGIYIHVPFCKSKCAYCDFYSYRADDITKERYTAALVSQIENCEVRLSSCPDTVYFGGGTPSLLGGKNIAKILSAVKKRFSVNFGEVTVECNPADLLRDEFMIMADAGVNRISLGVQSAVDNELIALSRRHGFDDVIRTVSDIKNAGIDNISVDLMLGIPHQNFESLDKSIASMLSLGPKHISCYMLKIEPDTPFGKADAKTLDLPDDDTVADMYIHTSEVLESNGFEHYEISNFAKGGFRSRHNVKYWNSDEYLGFGPAAHSFVGGKRFFYERDTEKYITSPTVISDGTGGDEQEYVMLRLRLSDGLVFEDFENKYSKKLPEGINKIFSKYAQQGYMIFDEKHAALTVKGFLVSNTIISEIIEKIC